MGARAAVLGGATGMAGAEAGRKRAVRKERRAKLAEAPVTGEPAASEARPREQKLTSVVYAKLRRAIVYGHLDMGEPLSENDLARALGVSKAPVRESLHELRLEGLVVVVPQSGSYVFSPTREQIEELCDFRSLLESRALRASMELAPRPMLQDLRRCLLEMKRANRTTDLFTIKRLDTEFHQAIARHSGNQYLIQSYATISHSVEALRYRFMDPAIYRNQAHEEHQKIVDLIAANNTQRAVEVLMDHIARTKQFQAQVSWSAGRLRRKDYNFRDYSQIFAAGAEGELLPPPRPVVQQAQA